MMDEGSVVVVVVEDGAAGVELGAAVVVVVVSGAALACPGVPVAIDRTSGAAIAAAARSRTRGRCSNLEDVSCTTSHSLVFWWPDLCPGPSEHGARLRKRTGELVFIGLSEPILGKLPELIDHLSAFAADHPRDGSIGT